MEGFVTHSLSVHPTPSSGGPSEGRSRPLHPSLPQTTVFGREVKPKEGDHPSVGRDRDHTEEPLQKQAPSLLPG